MNTFFSNKILTDFIAISTWQTLLVVITFITLQVGLWVFLKRYKLQFMWRVIIGMGIGLVFGIITQASIGFPNNDEMFCVWTNDEGKIISEFKDEYLWIEESVIWISLFKNIFIAGVMMLCIPIVFLAVLRVTSKPGVKGLGKIAAKGVALLLINVAIAFIITFWLGYLVDIGNGQDLTGTDTSGVESGMKPIPELIGDYVPNNIITALAGTAIIPVMIIAALMGASIRILSKRNKDQMNKFRAGTEVAWKISSSMMMNFMKILPIAVMAMLTTSIIGRPIGALASIGKVIGIGYLALAICVGILTLQIMLSGIKVKQWWKRAWIPFTQGFATQSALATLPSTLSTVEGEMKVNSRVVSTIGSMSTTLGLMACAGVQAGITASLLWTGTANDSFVHDMGIIPFFFVALLITVIASLGIAGVPGTATIVTTGVLGGMGFGMFIAPVLAIIQPLDGLFDMGRTGVNVLGANAVMPIVAKSEGLIDDDSPLIGRKATAKQHLIRSNKEFKYMMKDDIEIKFNAKNKALMNKELSKEEKDNIKLEFKDFVQNKKSEYDVVKENSQRDYDAEIELILKEKMTT